MGPMRQFATSDLKAEWEAHRAQHPEQDTLDEDSDDEQVQSEDIPAYGDHSSIYWSPGWNYQRFNKFDLQDIMTLSDPDAEHEKMKAGMRAALREDGYAKWMEHRFGRENRAREKEMAALFADKPPDYAVDVRMHAEGGKWGFVAMRTACYDDEQKWQHFKERLDKILNIQFSKDKGRPGVDAARDTFELHWVEDSSLDGASTDVLRERYKKLLPMLPPGQRHQIFLNATSEVIDSILENELPSKKSKHWRLDAPFIVAVYQFSVSGLEEDNPEKAYFRESFKVALEVVTSSLWTEINSVDNDGFYYHRMTIFLQDGAIWWYNSRSPEQMEKRSQRRAGRA